MKKDKDERVIRETGSTYGESQKETRRSDESARAKKGQTESAERFKPGMEQAMARSVNAEDYNLD